MTLTVDEIKTLAWIIDELYNGGAWYRMEKERPEINELTERIGVWDQPEPEQEPA